MVGDDDDVVDGAGGGCRVVTIGFADDDGDGGVRFGGGTFRSVRAVVAED